MCLQKPHQKQSKQTNKIVRKKKRKKEIKKEAKTSIPSIQIDKVSADQADQPNEGDFYL